MAYLYQLWLTIPYIFTITGLVVLMSMNMSWLVEQFVWYRRKRRRQRLDERHES